ncbi:MAG: tetratricopeptide repeat protein [Ferruginibacter sp.]|nr:tetratricopeptide repeat protein [Ferruginibacter sp.]
MLLKFIFLWSTFFLAQTSFLFAQKQGQALIDSLIVELPKAKPDTNKVKLLNMLSYNYSGIDSRETMSYASQALELATNLKWNKGIATALLNTEPYYVRQRENDSAIANLLKALHIAEKEKEWRIVCQIKIYLIWVYPPSAYTTSRALCEEVLALSKQKNDKFFEASALWGIGSLYYTLSDFAKALEFFQKANKVAEETNDAHLIQSTFTNIAAVFFFYDVPKAIQNYKSAAAICEQYGYVQDLAFIYGNLSLLYTDGMNFELGVEYNKKSLALFERLDEKPGMAAAYGNIGYTYIGMQDYVQALQFTQKALDLSKYLPPAQTVDNLIDMARIYTEAPPAALQAIGVTAGEAHKKAIDYGSRAVELGKKGTALTQLSDAYKYLSLANQKQGNHEQALVNFKEYITVRDSSFNLSKKTEITRRDMQFEFDKKQLSDSIQNAEMKKAEGLKLQRQRTYTYTSFAGIGLLLLLLFVIFRVYQKKKKSNALLLKTLEELTAAQQQLIKSEKMAAFGSLATRLAHEIQNPLNFVNNFSDLSTDLVNEILNSDKQEDKADAAQQLIANLDKINHHGKRAESFIKQLLKHGRDGTAHEYLGDS